MSEALAETARRKADGCAKDMLARIEPSRYGGFRVRSTPADLYIDQMTDGPFFSLTGGLKTMAGA
jgi:hypothetical protein